MTDRLSRRGKRTWGWLCMINSIRNPYTICTSLLSWHIFWTDTDWIVFFLNIFSHSFKFFMLFSFYEGSTMTVCRLSHRITAPRQLAKSKLGPAFTFWLPLLERSKKPSRTTKGAFLLWNSECNSFQLPFVRHKSQISALLLGAAATFSLIRLPQSDTSDR